MPPNWANRTLWTGDNLDIMRGMNSESVDLIYLDPPFNSNRDYSAPIGSEAAGAAFKDTWALSDVDEAWHGEIADRQPTLYAIIDAAGLSHGKGMKSYLIMMAVRFIEMRRILKESGSIYLHCDPVANHYLKSLMDATFGQSNFRDEIVWRRNESGAKGSQHSPMSWGSNVDYLLFYTKGNKPTFEPRIKALDNDGLYRLFPKVDENGERYSTKLTAWRQPSMGDRPNLCYEFLGVMPPHPSGWRLSKKRMEEEHSKGNIVVANGRLERRSYAKDYRGVSPGNLWSEKELLLGAQSRERTGYPTQKPLALLERLIVASSDKNHVMFDPFCGCATACVAAERLQRQWVGIDLSPLAATLVKSRLRKEMGLFYDIHHRTDIPRRTDQGDLPNYKTHRHTLYGRQEGICTGCQVMFPFHNMTVDHVVPQSKSGSDHLHNLQLLCAACNSMKGAQSQEAFIAKLKATGLRQ